MSADPQTFFSAVLSAGAILSGFCGTFLSFRIQREANYYRQPALSYDREQARDIYIGLTHFTSAFFLLGLATFCAVLFGFVLPLFALAGSSWAANLPLVVGGLIATVVLLLAYFVDEMVHYEILSSSLLNDAEEWGSEKTVVLVGLLLAVCLGLGAAWLAVHASP